MNTKIIAASLFMIGLLGVGLFQNCSQVQFEGAGGPASESPNGVQGLPVTPVATPTPIDPVIVSFCSKLENSTTAACNNLPGFTGNLYVEPASTMVMGYHVTSTKFPIGVTMVDSYIRPDWKQPVQVNLSSLAITATNFTNGFNLSSNSVLQDSSGQTLNEWFALDLYGTFHLDSNDAPGLYQFAIVSDDGARVFYSDDGTFPSRLLIDNQHPSGNTTPQVGVSGQAQVGSQSPLMGCATQYTNGAQYAAYKAFDASKIVQVPFAATSKINLRVMYYQGPRAGLAAYFMYRKVPATTSGAADQMCGLLPKFTPGNADFDDMFSKRGWKTVGPNNLN